MKHCDKMEYILLGHLCVVSFSKGCLFVTFPNAVLKLVVCPQLLACNEVLNHNYFTDRITCLVT